MFLKMINVNTNVKIDVKKYNYDCLLNKLIKH